MVTQKSFSLFERVQQHKFRNDMNKSKSINEISNVFSDTVCRLLQDDLKLTVKCDDVKFNPNSENHFSYSDEIVKNPSFSELLKTSDIQSIIKRFAHSTHDRFVKLQKHNDRTTVKIKG